MNLDCSLICSVRFYPDLETVVGCRCSTVKSVKFLSAENPSYSFSSYPGFSMDVLDSPTSFLCQEDFCNII